ncbi:MAG TPA: chaperonin GroEL [Bacteroidales bacterium]|nr:chaperonin GroEL [Bacteroidales bacterium]
MVKDFKTADQARAALAEGMQQVCRLLSGTYGPTGCNVVMDDENGNLLLSAQTYSVLRNLKSKDLFLDEGIQMAKEAAWNTKRLAGDGSVTTLLFMEAMICQGKWLIAAGANPVMLGRGLKKALPVVKNKIKEMAEPFLEKKLLQLLQYELKDDRLAEMLYNTYQKVGMEGTVIVKEGHGLSTELVFLEGFAIASGCLPMYRDEKDNRRSVYQPYILIVDCVIDRFAQLLPVLEQIVDSKAALIIVAEDIRGEARTLLQSNIQKKVLDAAVIKTPGIGRRKADLLQDLAVFTGGCVIDKDHPLTLENVKLYDLGRAGEVRIEQGRTMFLEGRGDRERITRRIANIKEQIYAKDTEYMNKDPYQERIGNLEGSIAVIQVGAPSLLQMHEETHRIQSALAFVRAVVSGGVLPGGGSALAAVSGMLWDSFHEDPGPEEEKLGKLMLLEAIKAPARTFLRKDGMGEKESLKIMTDSAGRTGYDIIKHEFTDMKEAGIYDAVTVAATALEQAVSVVYEWLRTEVLMVSVSPDREDITLMKQGVPIMR